MKRTILICLVLCLIAPITIDAQKEPLGNGLYWELNNDVLTISGNGAMPDYSSPWKDKGTIRKIVIEYGVTAIGNASFWK